MVMNRRYENDNLENNIANVYTSVSAIIPGAMAPTTYGMNISHIIVNIRRDTSSRLRTLAVNNAAAIWSLILE